ncbi:MAG: prolipoprotein diacylglyceryl transferase [Armatimonadota bacterium]|nr:prolipoprotein diacylglyceryl transferase [Armatimonadota bacterium]MDR7423290.1 prolipoprotein diacylglyceryl transferase [Armatimonadota bacterium]MDR7456565.1 prolipoprotein diacylglyceryl transferase [Armatimonadota bacterium]MDR7497352.1 prolipoprotein diacylglyceryl transferase [Armatimonadota bacterium]MDR7512570.1 prolipoprotein diacylglyceryl transferase [Armatimonadota bacterium]
MDPVLIQLGPLAIRWYGVLLAATIGLAIVVAYRLGPRLGVPAAVVDRTAVTCAVAALVGARIGYVVSHPGQFSTLLDVVRVDQGGLSSHGALAAGLLYVTWAARRAGISVWAFADAFVWAVPIGNVLVRIGNFINGELYGDPTSLPWGVRFATAPDVPRHPLQLYEAALAVAILLYARRVAARRRFAGEVFWTIVVATSLGRLAFDALRSDVRVLGPLALGQVPALILVVWGAWALWQGARHPPQAS